MISPEHYDVIILGAGASGLFCAFTAAQRGRRVLVLEKANKVGKKILMSGGGRCNFTNYHVSADNFLSANPHFCKSALKGYTQWDFIALVDRHSIAWEERKHGQLFCLDSARDILNLLLDECASGGAEIRTQCEVEKVTAQDSGGYLLKVSQQARQQSLSCASLVVATGALSIPTLGGSGIGYQLAEQFGLPVLPRRAGLVPFMFSDELKGLCERLSGLALDIEVSCRGRSFRENMLFTHRGMSGPSMLQISNYWQPGDSLSINLVPELDLTAELLNAKRDSKVQLKTWLGKVLPRALALELLQRYWPEQADKPLAECPDKLLKALASRLQAWEVKPAGTEGYRTAEVTLGGVDTRAISSKTMQVREHPGLYFIGEVLDVTGHLGGFNFQWAWSSAHCAGQYV